MIKYTIALDFVARLMSESQHAGGGRRQSREDVKKVRANRGEKSLMSVGRALGGDD